MRVSTAVRWTGLALLGILVAAAVSIAASRLASQQIGLASEPISAGDALAPSQRDHQPAATAKHAAQGQAKHTQPSPLPSAPTQPPAEPTPAESTPTPTPPVEATEPNNTNGDGEHSDGGADD